MFKSLAFIAGVIVACGVVWTVLRSDSVGARPPLQIENPAPLQLGEVFCGEPLNGEVRLRNSHKRSIELVRTETFCGCVTIDCGSLPRSIAANEVISCKFGFAPLSAAGPAKQPIILHFADGFPALTLNIEALAIQPLPALVDFGTAALPWRQSLTVRSLGDLNAPRITSHFVDPRSSQDWISETPNGLELAIEAANPGELFDRTVRVEYDNGYEQLVRVRGWATDGIVVDPETATFGAVRRSSLPARCVVRMRTERGDALGPIAVECDTTVPVRVRELVQSATNEPASHSAERSFEILIEAGTDAGPIGGAVRLLEPNSDRCVVVQCVGTLFD